MRLKLLLIVAVLFVAPMAFAGSYSLNDWCFYVNTLDINHSCNNGSGTDNFLPPVEPGTFDYVHLNDSNTLGTATVTLAGGQSYNVFAIYNYDIADGGGLNEFASAVGSLAIGQVYSVGVMGSRATPGSLYSQFASGTLDSTNHLDSCSTPGSCGDVAVSIGYTNLVVPAGSNTTVNFVVSNTPPDSGFYIAQTDSNTNQQLFISENTQTTSGGGSNLNLSGNLTSNLTASEATAPEPASTVLMGGGMSLMLWFVRRRRKA